MVSEVTKEVLERRQLRKITKLWGFNAIWWCPYTFMDVRHGLHVRIEYACSKLQACKMMVL